MVARAKCRFAAVGGLVLLILASTACVATRKYVRTQAVAPLQANIKAVDQKVDSKTNELDQRISDVDRHSEQGIAEASQKADTAGQNAQLANQSAQGAQQTADKGVHIASHAQHQIDNIDNYQAVKTEDVLFGFNRSDLTTDGQQQLDSLTETLGSLKHYAIEVEGFTDQTGPKPYNLELSRRRADAVVRYLTENAHVPLVKIHMLGLGEDQPAADNQTREGRKQNRRVQIRIMAPDMGEPSQAEAPHNSVSTLRSQQ